MTVTELIEKLQEFPENMNVIMEIGAFLVADVTSVTGFDEEVVLRVEQLFYDNGCERFFLAQLF